MKYCTVRYYTQSVINCNPGQGFSLIVVTNHMICESDAIYVYLFFSSRDFSTIIIATHASFIDYNDQSNNPKCTVYLYDSFLHMSCDFLSIIDVIVLFSHKTLIRCHFNFSIVEFNCDDYSTFLCIPNQCLLNYNHRYYCLLFILK